MAVADLDWRLRRMSDQLVLAAADPVTGPQEPTEPELPPETIDEKLRGWTANEPAWTWAAVYPHSSYPEVVASADVVWPDLSPGKYTVLTINADLHQWDSFKVTHVASGKTVTRTVKGRDANGMVTGYTTTIT